MVDPVRLAEHVHGHLGWLGAALLVHPAIVLRDRARRAHLAVVLSTSLVTLAAGLGLWLYGAYRARLRQGIFIDSRAIGLLFERKEHLAFGAVMLAWSGAAAYAAATRASAEGRLALRTLAFRCFCASAALAVVVAIFGTVVATYRSF